MTMTKKKWLKTILFTAIFILISPILFLITYRVSCLLPSIGDDITEQEAIEIAYEIVEKRYQGPKYSHLDFALLRQPTVSFQDDIDAYMVKFYDDKQKVDDIIFVFLNGCIE